MRSPGGRRGSAARSVPARTISFWCFNSGVAMRDLLKQGVRSVILTSGTLAPLPSLAVELQTYAAAALHGSALAPANRAPW